MSDESMLRVLVDLRLNVDPIEGRVTGPDGHVRDFCGWTSLAAALERASRSWPPPVRASHSSRP